MYIYYIYMYFFAYTQLYIREKTVKHNAFVASVMARPSRSCPTSFTESQEIQAMDSDLEDYHRKNTQLQVVGTVFWFRFGSCGKGMLIPGAFWTVPFRISHFFISSTKRRSVCYSGKKKMKILQSFPQRFAAMMNIVDTGKFTNKI